MADESNAIKVVVLGSGYQGKSALIIRFVSGIFVTDYDPTIEDNYRKLIVVDNAPVLLEILDTAGQEEYASMSEQWMEEGQIFILLYAVNSEKESCTPDILTPYDHCRYLRDKILKIKGDDSTPIILVGTKCEIAQDQRTFTAEDGDILSKEFNCKYLEVSAKNNKNLDMLWTEVVKVYTAYIKSLGTDYTFSLNSERGSIANSLMDNDNICCTCCTCFSGVKSKQSSDRNHRMDEIITTSSAFAGVKHKSKATHTRVNTLSTESEMQSIPGIHIDEEDILNVLDDVDNEDDNDTQLEQIAEIVINDHDMNETKEEKVNVSGGDREVYIPKLSVGSDIANKDQIKLFPVHNLPKDKGFEPILSSKHFSIGRTFYWKRFLISIICGMFLPIVILLQTFAFLVYIEGNKGVFYYPKIYKYNDIHGGILFDFMGLVIGRKPNQDPEIEKDRKWFLRQTCLQKIERIMLTLWICILYFICIHNVYLGFNENGQDLRVSLMETIGPLLLYCVIWILLSLWIAYESKIKPHLPPLTRLRSINLYFGDNFDRTTSAYKFLRGYLSSIDKNKNLKLGCLNILIIIILGVFYGCIPGLTRLFVGDPSDGLDKKKFITYKEWQVEVGALIVNACLMIAMLYTVQVQYKKYIENYKEWMFELTMFLVSEKDKMTTFDDQLDDDLDDNLFGEFNEVSYSEPMEGKYFPEHLYLSLKRKSNILGWLEIRSFLSYEGKLFFAEQELPLLWILIITSSLTMFILYRVFFIDGNPLQSILYNGVSILNIICLVALLRVMIIVHQFNALQIKQESFIEMQKFVIRCCNNNIDEESDDDDDDDGKTQEIQPLITNNIPFIDDMLTLIKRKDIYPKLYEIKINAVLIPVIVCIIILAIVLLLKLFVGDLLF